MSTSGHVLGHVQTCEKSSSSFEITFVFGVEAIPIDAHHSKGIVLMHSQSSAI